MKKWIQRISPQDSLNKAATVVTLITGFTAMLTFFGSQSLSAILLSAVSLTALSFLIYRTHKQKKEVEKKNAILNEVFDVAGHLTSDMHAIRTELLYFLKSSSEKGAKQIGYGLGRCMNSLAQIVSTHTGVKCHVSCTLLLKNEGGHLSLRTLGDNVTFRLDQLTESDTLYTGRPLIFADLADLAATGKYVNPDPNWQMFYQSAVVVPIKAGSSGGYESLYGFLVVNSPKPNSFKESILPVLEFYADWCGLLLGQLEIQGQTFKSRLFTQTKTREILNKLFELFDRNVE